MIARIPEAQPDQRCRGGDEKECSSAATHYYDDFPYCLDCIEKALWHRVRVLAALADLIWGALLTDEYVEAWRTATKTLKMLEHVRQGFIEAVDNFDPVAVEKATAKFKAELRR